MLKQYASTSKYHFQTFPTEYSYSAGSFCVRDSHAGGVLGGYRSRLTVHCTFGPSITATNTHIRSHVKTHFNLFFN